MAATNPFSQSGLINTLRAKGISSNDISDESLGTLIDDALRTYLFYKPKVCITTHATCIHTVADQPNYAKPTDALWIRSVAWNPTYSATELEDMWKDILLATYPEDDPSMLMLDYMKMSELNRLFKGHWEIRNDEIWLKPVPDGVYHVAVIYATSRTLDELDQIGDNRFVDLAFYTALMAVGTSKLTGGGWRAGQLSVSESVGRETMKVAEGGLNDTLLKISNNYVAGRS